MNILIDTNVIIDAFHDRTPFNRAAQSLLIGVSKYYDAYITPTSLINISYITNRDHNKRHATQHIIEGIISCLQIIDVTEDDCLAAITAKWPDFEDCVLAQTAHRHHLDYIITRNVKDFAHSPVPAITPEAFLTKLQKS